MNVRERVVLEREIRCRHPAAQVERLAFLLGKHFCCPSFVHAFVMHLKLSVQSRRDRQRLQKKRHICARGAIAILPRRRRSRRAAARRTPLDLRTPSSNFAEPIVLMRIIAR
jgi:hypothetical protein